MAVLPDSVRILPALRSAAVSLLQHKLRSGLSMLGIVCGIMAVLAVLAISQGAREEARRQLEQMGLRHLYIRADHQSQEQKRQALLRQSPGLQDSDRLFLENTVPQVRATASVREVTMDLPGLQENLHPRLLACTTGYARILGITIQQGRFLSDQDLRGGELVCVLGADIASHLGPAGGIGGLLQIGGQQLRVVGILARQEVAVQEARLSSQALNNAVVFPLGIVGETGISFDFPALPVSEIIVELDTSAQLTGAVPLVRRTMEVAHRGVEDFQLIVPLELVARSQEVQRVFNLVLAIIAVITLAVGGIGIMNVMLASVSERVREIGLRRALGASPTHIQRQFLIEAVLLTLAGGIAGISGGVILAWGVAWRTGWPLRFDPVTCLIPLALSFVLGIFFGLHPARKAASLDPVTALETYF